MSSTDHQVGTPRLKTGLAEMLKGQCSREADFPMRGMRCEAELAIGSQAIQGQSWKLQLAGGQRSISRFAFASHGSPCPQFPMPETVDRLVPLIRFWPPFCTDPD